MAAWNRFPGRRPVSCGAGDLGARDRQAARTGGPRASDRGDLERLPQRPARPGAATRGRWRHWRRQRLRAPRASRRRGWGGRAGLWLVRPAPGASQPPSLAGAGALIVLGLLILLEPDTALALLVGL